MRALLSSLQGRLADLGLVGRDLSSLLEQPAMHRPCPALLLSESAEEVDVVHRLPKPTSALLSLPFRCH